MRRWSFRLERVERIRRIERDRARGAWAQARRDEVDAESRLDAVRSAAQADAAGLVPGSPVASVGGPDALRAAAFRATLRAQSATLAAADLTEARSATAAAHSVLLDADRRVEALSRLEATQREAWRVEFDRESAKAADDVAGTRYAAAAIARARSGEGRVGR